MRSNREGGGGDVEYQGERVRSNRERGCGVPGRDSGFRVPGCLDYQGEGVCSTVRECAYVNQQGAVKLRMCSID